MAEDSPPQVTVLLRAWREGDQAALDRLTRIVYSELHRLAHRYMTRERPDHTLQTSALVDEAYLRLVDARQVDWKNQAHFFAVSSTLMRRFLVDSARSHASQKRGGNVPKVELDEGVVSACHRVEDLLALRQQLTVVPPKRNRPAWQLYAAAGDGLLIPSVFHFPHAGLPDQVYNRLNSALFLRK